MNALGTLHTTLRPNGLLLDIHPEPVQRYIEIHEQGRPRTLGQVNIPSQNSKVMAARAALQTVVDAGQFARERELIFEFLYHFDSLDAWLDYMTEPASDAHIDADMIVRGREQLRPGVGELCMRRRIRAALLRRV